MIIEIPIFNRTWSMCLVINTVNFYDFQRTVYQNIRYCIFITTKAIVVTATYVLDNVSVYVLQCSIVVEICQTYLTKKLVE